MTGEVKEAAVTGFGLNCYQVSGGQNLKICAAFLITAPAERNDLAGLEPDIIAVTFRSDIADIFQIYDIAVVAPKEKVLWKLFQYFRYLAGHANIFIFKVEDQMPVICLDIMASGIIKAMMSSFGGEPESWFGYRDLWAGFVILNRMFQLF